MNSHSHNVHNVKKMIYLLTDVVFRLHYKYDNQLCKVKHRRWAGKTSYVSLAPKHV